MAVYGNESIPTTAIDDNDDTTIAPSFPQPRAPTGPPAAWRRTRHVGRTRDARGVHAMRLVVGCNTEKAPTMGEGAVTSPAIVGRHVAASRKDPYQASDIRHAAGRVASDQSANERGGRECECGVPCGAMSCGNSPMALWVGFRLHAQVCVTKHTNPSV